MSSDLKKILILSVILVISTVSGSSAVINSDDWRDSFAGINYLSQQGEDFYLVQNPGEAEIAETRYPQSGVYISDSPGFAGLETSGQRHSLDWRKQYDYYQNVSGSVEGFIVVPADYGTEAAYTVSRAVDSDYFMIFRDERTAEFLEEESKETLFVGTEPESSGFEQKFYDGSVIERNREFLAESFESDAVYISEPGEVSVDALRNGYPVLLKSSVSATAEFMEENGIDAVMADSSLLSYVSRLQEAVPGETRALLSRGRVSGGELVADSKKITYSYRRPEPEISGSSFDPETGILGIEVSNPGNYPANLTLDSVNGNSVDRTVKVGAGDSMVYRLEMEEKPENLSVSYSSNAESDSKMLEVEEEDLSLPTDISVNQVSYNTSNGRMTAQVRNTGRREAWISVQTAYDTEISKELVAPGETKSFYLGVSKQRPSKVSIGLYQGFRPNSFRFDREITRDLDRWSPAAVIVIALALLLTAVYSGYFVYNEYLAPE